MSNIIAQTSTSRPVRTLPESQKDKKYHEEYARWCIASLNSDQSKYFQFKSLVNWNFYYGNQWLFKEDLDTFMLDESGETRNRVRFVENTIRPMVDSLVGKVIQTDFSAKAMSFSDRSVSRMEMELANLLSMQEIHDKATIPSVKKMIKDRTPIGKNRDETIDRFQRFYKDEYADLINILIRDIKEKNNVESLKVEVARYLAITGLGVSKGYHDNGMQKWEAIDPMYFIWDPGARKPDLSDSGFMGEYMNADPAVMLERYPHISEYWGEKLEKFSNILKNTSDFNLGHDIFGVTLGRVPVYEIYWRDFEKQTYGYVLDDFGYELYTRLDDEKGKYSVSDAIIPSDDKAKELMKGKKTKSIYMDVLRFCIFSPPEYIGANDKQESLVYDFGIAPYNETYLNDISNVDWPYKCHTWAYHNGYIQSPVDDAVHPQRFLNRVLSMAEAQANNSGGSGVMYDKDMVDGQDGEQEMLTNMNRSKPVGVRAKGRLNNSVMPYDLTIKDGTINLFNIAQQIRGSIDNSTGRNMAMRGQQGGKRESVGVTEAMLEAGATMQEPYFFAISQIMLKMAQSMANQGKRIYVDNKRKLAMLGGDNMARLVTLTEDLLLEDFKVYIKRTLPDDQSKAMANNDLKQLSQLGVVDEEAMAKYYNNATMDEIPDAIRESFNRKIEASKMAQEQQAAAAEEAMAMAQEEQMRGEEMSAAVADVQRRNEVEDQAIRKDADIEKSYAKEDAKAKGQLVTTK